MNEENRGTSVLRSVTPSVGASGEIPKSGERWATKTGPEDKGRGEGRACSTSALSWIAPP